MALEYAPRHDELTAIAPCKETTEFALCETGSGEGV